MRAVTVSSMIAAAALTASAHAGIASAIFAQTGVKSAAPGMGGLVFTSFDRPYRSLNGNWIITATVNTGVTYMTGALVKFGQKLAAGFLGGAKKDCLPFLWLWLGLISGAVLGAASYSVMGLNSLWFAAGFAAILFASIHRRA